MHTAVLQVLPGWLQRRLEAGLEVAFNALDCRSANDKAAKIGEGLSRGRAAYAIKQLPKRLRSTGQAHRKLGHAKAALGYYELYCGADHEGHSI